MAEFGNFGDIAANLFDYASDLGGDAGSGGIVSTLADVLRSGGSEAVPAIANTASDVLREGGSPGFTSPAVTPGTPNTVMDSIRGGVRDFGGVAKDILPLAQVGAAGAGVGLGVQGALQNAKMTRLAQDAAKRQGEISATAQGQAAPVAAFGQEALRRAGLGEVPPAVEAQIEQWRKAAQQMINDRAARLGQGSSTQMQQWLQWIDQQALAMRGAYLGQEVNQGLSAANVAGNLLSAGSSAAGGSGQTAVTQQSGIEGLISQANRALAQLSAAAG